MAKAIMWLGMGLVLVSAVAEAGIGEESEYSPEGAFNIFETIQAYGLHSQVVKGWAFSRTVEQWTAHLNSQDPWNRLVACGALACFGRAAITSAPALQRATNDKEPEVRIVAAQALWMITGDKTAISPAIEVLNDAHPEKRGFAAKVLAEIGPPAQAAIPSLLRLMKDTDISMRKAAIEAVDKIGAKPDQAVPVLSQACADSEKSVRAPAARALGKFGAAAQPAVPLLVGLLQDRQGTVRVAAAEALWQIERHPAAIPALIMELSTDAIYFGAAATVPADSTNPPTFDDPSCVHGDAIDAIVRMGPAATQAVSALRAFSKQTDRRVHIWAAIALWKIDPRDDPLPTLLAALTSNQYAVRHDAALALQQLKPPAKLATPALLDAMRTCAAEARNVPKRADLPNDFMSANGYFSLSVAWLNILNSLQAIDPAAAAEYKASAEYKAYTEYQKP